MRKVFVVDLEIQIRQYFENTKRIQLDGKSNIFYLQRIILYVFAEIN